MMVTDAGHQFVVTEDGSLSLKDGVTGELFHNRAGAYTEALLNFVQPLSVEKWIGDLQELIVLDVCFGLGYNSFVLLDFIRLLPVERVKIVGIERDRSLRPLLREVLSSEKFRFISPLMAARSEDFQTFEIQRENGDSAHVELEFLNEDARESVPRLDVEGRQFDVVFHDPFSPKRMPELWTVDLFHCYFRMLRRPHGRLVTYSLAGSVRGGLRQAGFTVFRTEAVGEKSGGTLALLPENQLAPNAMPLTDEEEARLKTRSGLPLRDPGFKSTRTEILRLRELEQKNF